MANLALDIFDVFPLFYQKACIGMPQIVKPNSGKPCGFKGGIEMPVYQIVMVNWIFSFIPEY